MQELAAQPIQKRWLFSKISFRKSINRKLKLLPRFLWKTKTDIFHIMAEAGRKDFITSAVSCSQTFKNRSQATHCGSCSQCIDRRFAAYGSELDDVDEGGIYTLDFIQRGIEDNEVKIALIDFVRQAKRICFAKY